MIHAFRKIQLKRKNDEGKITKLESRLGLIHSRPIMHMRP